MNTYKIHAYNVNAKVTDWQFEVQANSAIEAISVASQGARFATITSLKNFPENAHGQTTLGGHVGFQAVLAN